MQIFQTHLIFEDPAKSGAIRHFVDYIESDDETIALSKISQINPDQESYVLRVSTSTIVDEIEHCKKLIAYWRNPPSPDDKNPHIDIIIERQENLIKRYEAMILRQAYQNFPHLRDKNVDG